MIFKSCCRYLIRVIGSKKRKFSHIAIDKGGTTWFVLPFILTSMLKFYF